ncbi:MAG: protein-L-isoaspartate(D-aspartate) O-methyltransferase [Anaerolineales bacterium]|jgi:protein-L-isoaspartate(D-aspartate) O-methyltransferase|nr:protein-L-isoaspartate(D-aspartate) O-methyltransferase [Anaerolineales bacterium]
MSENAASEHSAPQDSGAHRFTIDDTLFVAEREQMVEEQIFQRGVRDPRVLEAMREVPRHCFVPPEYRYLAYTDGPLPIGSGQTISQPYIVALMTELLRLKGHEKVLEVGAGSGYQAAILSRLAREVHTIERHANLARQAARILSDLGLENVHVHIGDGTLGLPEHAPYDGILVTAAAPQVPGALLQQLADGGRMVIPVGGRGGQVLEVWTREGERYDYESVLPVAFVPLVGEQGWKD